MTPFAQNAVIQAVSRTTTGPGFIQRLRRHVARLDAALAGQARLSAIQPEALHDTGLSAEQLTGAPTYDPALPFFLQSGFGRNER